jgi:hypothetical protein
MKLSLTGIANGDLAERGLSELGALWGNLETPSLQVANRETGSVRVYKVQHLPATVRENCCFIFSVDELAVVDEQASGDAVAEGL